MHANRHNRADELKYSHPYMTTGKTIALTRRTFVGKVMSLLQVQCKCSECGKCIYMGSSCCEDVGMFACIRTYMYACVHTQAGLLMCGTCVSTLNIKAL